MHLCQYLPGLLAIEEVPLQPRPVGINLPHINTHTEQRIGGAMATLQGARSKQLQADALSFCFDPVLIRPTEAAAVQAAPDIRHRCRQSLDPIDSDRSHLQEARTVGQSTPEESGGGEASLSLRANRFDSKGRAVISSTAKGSG